MNKSSGIGLAIVLILIGAGGYYLGSHPPGVSHPSTTLTVSTTNSTMTSSTASTITTTTASSLTSRTSAA